MVNDHVQNEERCKMNSKKNWISVGFLVVAIIMDMFSQ
jgi:hypothetical protein